MPFNLIALHNIESLERIQKTASEILEAVVIDKESEYKIAGGESHVAVAA